MGNDIERQKYREQSNSLNRSMVFQVRDTQLASALVAVGIPLRKDPPYTVKRLVSGNKVVTWLFADESPEGLKTGELVQAWENAVEFGEKNPTHPFTYAMHTIQNYKQMVEHIHTSKPWIGFMSKSGKHTIWVIEGSKRHQACVDEGLDRTDENVTVEK